MAAITTGRAHELAPDAPVARRDRYEDTESLDGTSAWLDAERRNHERDEIETMRREMMINDQAY